MCLRKIQKFAAHFVNSSYCLYAAASTRRSSLGVRNHRRSAREIVVRVICSITRCVGMKRANSVVCIIVGGIVFVVMQFYAVPKADVQNFYETGYLKKSLREKDFPKLDQNL